MAYDCNSNTNIFFAILTNFAAGSCKECESPFAITHSQLRTLSPRTIGQQRVAGAIPDLRPSLDSDVRTALIGSPSRTTLITGVGSSLSILVTLVSMYSWKQSIQGFMNIGNSNKVYSYLLSKSLFLENILATL